MNFAFVASLTTGLLFLGIRAAVMSITIYVILDLEYPRLGLIRVDAADQLLRDVRAAMN